MTGYTHGEISYERWTTVGGTECQKAKVLLIEARKNFRIIETGGNQVAIEVEKKKLREEDIFLQKEKNRYKHLRL